MNVLGHHDITYHHEAVALAHFFENCRQQIAPLPASQPRLPMITTASYEMQLVRAVIPPRMVGHKASLLVPAIKSCDIRPRRSHLCQNQDRKGGPATRPHGSLGYAPPISRAPAPKGTTS